MSRQAGTSGRSTPVAGGEGRSRSDERGCGGPVIATARLVLRPFASADESALLDLFRDRDVRRYLLDDERVSAAWVRDEIESSMTRFGGGEAGLWSIRLARDPAVVGFAGFREFFSPPELQLLYGLLPRVWGRGLATEAAGAVVDHAFDSLSFAEVRAAVDLPNEASARVLARLGMTRSATTEDGPAGTAFYSVDRRAWVDLPRRTGAPRRERYGEPGP